MVFWSAFLTIGVINPWSTLNNEAGHCIKLISHNCQYLTFSVATAIEMSTELQRTTSPFSTLQYAKINWEQISAWEYNRIYFCFIASNQTKPNQKGAQTGMDAWMNMTIDNPASIKKGVKSQQLTQTVTFFREFIRQ